MWLGNPGIQKSVGFLVCHHIVKARISGGSLPHVSPFLPYDDGIFLFICMIAPIQFFNMYKQM